MYSSYIYNSVYLYRVRRQLSCRWAEAAVGQYRLRSSRMCALLGVCMCVSVGADTSPAPTVVLALASGVDG